MEMTNVVPLNSGSTKNAPPSCWMPGNADGEDEDAEYRAPDVDPAGLDRGRAEECANERRKQIVEADIRLADPELGGEHAAGESGDQPGGDKHADDVGPDRDAVERGGLLVGADRVDMTTNGQPLADDPKTTATTST